MLAPAIRLARWHRLQMRFFRDTRNTGPMIVVRFKMQSHPDKVDEVRSLLTDVAVVSQSVKGVVSFDIGQDVTDSNSFVATEVFDDKDALERQESLPEVAAAMAAFETALAAEPEATIFNVASAEPYA